MKVYNPASVISFYQTVIQLIHCRLETMVIVQLPNWVLGVKRVLGYGNRFIVDYITWTCPEPKSVGCHLGTLGEFFLQPKKMAFIRHDGTHGGK